MKFDLRQLQAFVTLADTANYREAASRLFITQPALTKQIQGLEQTLGCTLFKRGRHGAELTALGAQLLTQASALVEHGRSSKAMRWRWRAAWPVDSKLASVCRVSHWPLRWWPASNSRSRT